MILHAIAGVILAYVLGGIPIGLLVGRMKGVPDIRRFGSGNIGATNVLRVLGAKAGAVVWAADCLKGLIPVLVGRHALELEGWWLGAVAVSAVAGHCFSPFLRFTGGRGVSTGLGITLGLFWPVGLCSLVVFVLVVARTRYISLGSIIGAASAPVWMGAWGNWVAPYTGPYMASTAVMAAILIFRHAPNIRRLRAGTEPRLGERVTPPVPQEAPREDG